MHADIEKMFDLTGKAALITGGARNFGYEMAGVLAGAGCNVAITSRTLSHAEETAAKLKETYSVDALALELDQTDAARVRKAVKAAHAWKGRLDILVNNAGGGSGKGPCHLFERTPEDMDRLISLNLNGALYCCAEAAKVMAKQGSGKIINIASIAGIVGRDRRMYERNKMAGQPIDYAAAKAGVIGMTRDLAGLLSPMGICVNAISPGGFNRNLPEDFVKDYSDRTALGRMGRDGIDLKGAALFLASPASDYVTGLNLVVDGGFSIWH